MIMDLLICIIFVTLVLPLAVFGIICMVALAVDVCALIKGRL